MTTLTSVKYEMVASRLDHVRSTWSSRALLVAILNAVHAIGRDVAKWRQLFRLNTVRVRMRRCRVVRNWAGYVILKIVELTTKLSILHTNGLHLVARGVEIALQAVDLALKTIDVSFLLINQLLLALMLSNGWKKLALLPRILGREFVPLVKISHFDAFAPRSGA